MSPVVEAAWIAAITGGVGVVGTVVVAISGHRTTNKTTVLALDAARGDRLWDKQAATYEETLAALLYRAGRRRDQVTTARWTEEPVDAAKEFFASYDPPGWFQTQGRLLAYASDRVLASYREAEDADLEVARCYASFVSLTNAANRTAAAAAFDAIQPCGCRQCRHFTRPANTRGSGRPA